MLFEYLTDLLDSPFEEPSAQFAYVGCDVDGAVGREENHDQKNNKLQSRHISISPFPIILILQSLWDLWWVMDLWIMLYTNIVYMSSKAKSFKMVFLTYEI